MKQLLGQRRGAVVQGHTALLVDEPGVVDQGVGFAVHGLGALIERPCPVVVLLRASDLAEIVQGEGNLPRVCLLYTSDAADERSSVDLGGRRIIKKKKQVNHTARDISTKPPSRAR